MRWGEARELAGMSVILGMLIVAGMGLSSMAEVSPEASETVEVLDVPAAEMPAEIGPYRAAGPAGSAESAGLPVGVPLGV